MKHAVESETNRIANASVRASSSPALYILKPYEQAALSFPQLHIQCQPFSHFKQIRGLREPCTFQNETQLKYLARHMRKINQSVKDSGYIERSVWIPYNLTFTIFMQMWTNVSRKRSTVGNLLFFFSNFNGPCNMYAKMGLVVYIDYMSTRFIEVCCV